MGQRRLHFTFTVSVFCVAQVESVCCQRVLRKETSYLIQTLYTTHFLKTATATTHGHRIQLTFRFDNIRAIYKRETDKP